MPNHRAIRLIYAETQSCHITAERLNCSHTTVLRSLQAQGIPRKDMKRGPITLRLTSLAIGESCRIDDLPVEIRQSLHARAKNARIRIKSHFPFVTRIG